MRKFAFSACITLVLASCTYPPTPTVPAETTQTNTELFREVPKDSIPNDLLGVPLMPIPASEDVPDSSLTSQEIDEVSRMLRDRALQSGMQPRP